MKVLRVLRVEGVEGVEGNGFTAMANDWSKRRPLPTFQRSMMLRMLGGQGFVLRLTKPLTSSIPKWRSLKTETAGARNGGTQRG